MSLFVGQEIPFAGVLIAVSGFVFLSLFILLCIFKQRKTRRRAAANMTRSNVDENPVYGVYFDTDPRMEVEDTNDYYSSDYEPVGTSRTTDNNPYYE